MDLLTSLVAYWKLDETSGTRNDAHSTNHLSDNNTVTSAAGKQSNAAEFVATNSEYLSISDNANLSTGDVDFTIAGWFYLASKTLGRDLVMKWGTSGNFEYALVYNDSSDRFEFYVSSTGSNAVGAVGDNLGSPSTATWYFIVAYHDSVGDVIGISINNGAANTTAYSLGVFNSSADFALGTRLPTISNYHDGRIDETGFWKRVLNSSERGVLFNNGNGMTYPFSAPRRKGLSVNQAPHRASNF